MRLDAYDIIMVHDAIHNREQEKVTLHGDDYPIILTSGLRSVKINGILFIEQNKAKIGSRFAEAARRGDKITWGVQRGPWIKVVNRVINGDITI